MSLKKDVLKEDKVKLSLGDVLTALSICAATNSMVECALSKLSKLRGTELHSSCMLPEGELKMLKKLGINVTCQPEFETKELYGC